MGLLGEVEFAAYRYMADQSARSGQGKGNAMSQKAISPAREARQSYSCEQRRPEDESLFSACGQKLSGRPIRGHQLAEAGRLRCLDRGEICRPIRYRVSARFPYNRLKCVQSRELLSGIGSTLGTPGVLLALTATTVDAISNQVYSGPTGRR